MFLKTLEQTLTIGEIKFNVKEEILIKGMIYATAEVNGIMLTICLNKNKDFNEDNKTLKPDLESRILNLFPILKEKYNSIVNIVAEDYANFLNNEQKIEEKVTKEQILEIINNNELVIDLLKDTVLSARFLEGEDLNVYYNEFTDKLTVTVAYIDEEDENEQWQEKIYEHNLIK